MRRVFPGQLSKASKPTFSTRVSSASESSRVNLALLIITLYGTLT